MSLRLYDFALRWAMKGDVTFVNSVADGQRGGRLKQTAYSGWYQFLWRLLTDVVRVGVEVGGLDETDYCSAGRGNAAIKLTVYG